MNKTLVDSTIGHLCLYYKRKIHQKERPNASSIRGQIKQVFFLSVGTISSISVHLVSFMIFLRAVSLDDHFTKNAFIGQLQIINPMKLRLAFSNPSWRMWGEFSYDFR